MLPHGVLKRANDEEEEDGSDNSAEHSGQDYNSDYSNEQIDAPTSGQRFEIYEQRGPARCAARQNLLLVLHLPLLR